MEGKKKFGGAIRKRRAGGRSLEVQEGSGEQEEEVWRCEEELERRRKSLKV